MANSNIVLSVIVNYYNPTSNPCIAAMTIFALESLQANTASQLELIVSDGTGRVSEEIRARCETCGWIYLHSQQPIGFAAAYNVGMLRATGDFRAWMASDIFVPKNWDQILIGELQRTEAWIAMPYLTYSDYPVQSMHGAFQMKTCTPMAMTFNLNLMTSRCIELVGLMDETFTGNFNDLDYLLRIRAAGGEAILAFAGQVIHVGKATISSSTQVSGSCDRRRFIDKYPCLISPVRAWSYDLTSPLLCRSHSYRILIRAAEMVSRVFRNQTIFLIAQRLEPYFHSI